MLKACKRPSTKFLLWISFAFATLSCQSFSSSTEEAPARLTEREVTYQKGLALFNNNKQKEAAVFFLKVTQTPLSQNDLVYDQSLWKLASIYEKSGEFEKAVLALLELEKRQPQDPPLFRIQLALAKNYIRLENTSLALKIEKEMDQSYPARNFSLGEIFEALEDNSDFNYDHLIIEELQFLGGVQKYFIYVMESSEAPLNQKATELLIQIYDGFFRTLAKDTVTYEFKKTLSIELLDQLRKFETYRMATININPYTISKFSNYSDEKQKQLTDWLHQ